jgi:lipoprotein-anchoring transpeptidase ErfK/SrfK
MTHTPYHLEVSLSQQKLYLNSGNENIEVFEISTSAKGAGETMHSECTPRGKHAISEKIGAECEPGTVFVGRQPTGEIYSPALRAQFPQRDWILTRILRLEGLEEGFNRGGDVDSRHRLIYIHGSPDDVAMGVPGSHGCIRMSNADIIRLFGKVEAGTPVDIRE